ncbi:3-methyladenine DNA glycosylase AlkA [soil metagenome]
MDKPTPKYHKLPYKNAPIQSFVLHLEMEHLVHLNKDKKLKKIIALQEPYVLESRKNVYLHLCSSIMSQQLSTKVAAVIYNRFLNLYKNKKPTPQQIIDTPVETLRSIGLSNAKAQYVQNVCRFFIAEKITDASLHKMSNEELIKYLSSIKGVGQWTVEMILMFTLGREDVFALDDLGIQQGIAKLYNLDTTDKKALKAKMLEVSAKWSPYRTYACRYLWGWKDSPL